MEYAERRNSDARPFWELGFQILPKRSSQCLAGGGQSVLKSSPSLLASFHSFFIFTQSDQLLASLHSLFIVAAMVVVRGDARSGSRFLCPVWLCSLAMIGIVSGELMLSHSFSAPFNDVQVDGKRFVSRWVLGALESTRIPWAHGHGSTSPFKGRCAPHGRPVHRLNG